MSSGRPERRRRRAVAIALLAGVLVLALAVAVLVLTNPDPRQVSGWTELTPLPTPRGEVASAAHARGGELYVAGGFTGLASTSDAVAVYRAAEDAWEELPDLPEPRHHAAAALLDGDLFVTGGAEGALRRSPEASVWVLRDESSSWEELSSMPEPRLGHRLVSLHGRLFAVGGEGPSSHLLVYEPDEGWSRAARMPAQRDHLAAIVRDGEIWAIGGRTEDGVVTDVHVYDPEADEWRSGPELPVPVSGAVEGLIDRDIHLVGGEDPSLLGGGAIDRHLVLRDGAEAWQERDPPPLAVHGAAGGAIDGELLLAGGSARQGALSPIAWSDYVASFEP